MFQGAKNLDGAWTALGMDLIPPIATVKCEPDFSEGTGSSATGEEAENVG